MFDEEIGVSWMRVCASGRPGWWSLLLDMGEDLANEVGVGDVLDDAKSASAEGTKGDIDVEDPFQSLCPGERRG